MAVKAVNIKMEEERIEEVKSVAAVFHMTITDVIKDALDEYIPKMKNDPLYRLTANVQDASADETEEVLNHLESLSDDDLEISSRKSFQL